MCCRRRVCVCVLCMRIILYTTATHDAVVCVACMCASAGGTGGSGGTQGSHGEPYSNGDFKTILFKLTKRTRPHVTPNV